GGVGAMGMCLRRGARLRWVALAGLVGVCLTPPASAASLDALARSSEDRACAARTQTIQPLAVVRNTRDHDFSCLGLIVDAGATPVAIRFEVHHGRAAAGDRQPAPHIEVKEFDRDLIASGKGAVLDGQPGHDAVILHGALPGPAGAARSATGSSRTRSMSRFRKSWCGPGRCLSSAPPGSRRWTGFAPSRTPEGCPPAAACPASWSRFLTARDGRS